LFRIKGIFKGYRIKFWRTNDPNNVRMEDIVLKSEEVNLCPSLGKPSEPTRKRSVRSTETVRGITSKLWPYSKITAGVVVTNVAHDGVISNTVEFETPEGAPEVLKDLSVSETDANHIVVAWSLPEKFNGSIVSYIVEYKVAPPGRGDPHKIIIEDAAALSYKILGLDKDTNYVIILSAVTREGQGQAHYITQRTLWRSRSAATVVIGSSTTLGVLFVALVTLLRFN